jgi:predicted alpha/beta superfamily hydrolase
MKSLTLFACLVLFLNLLISQTSEKTEPKVKEEPFVFGLQHTLQSEELAEERILNIYLPDSYDPDSRKKHPVIYVLDGSQNEDFPHIAGLVQFMNLYQLLPDPIVVGVSNKGRSRYRDFTHVSTNAEDLKSLPQSGGSGKFIAYLEKEVQPHIEARFKTKGKGTLIGQSLGGLLATEILFHHSHLFDHYLIVSPSLWWNDGSLVKESESILQSHPDPKKKVFLALGEEGEEMQAGMDQLVRALEGFGPRQMKWRYESFPEETHATILHRAVYKGFEWLYGESD